MPTLIFCPAVVVNNWVQEWQKFSNLPASRVIALNKSQKERTLQVREADIGTIFVTNYEALLMEDLMQEITKKFYGRKCAVVFDESHRIKDPKAKRTKVAIKLSDIFSHRYILSGSPVLKSYMDLFTQFRVMDKSVFGTNYFSFRARYFRDKNAGMPSHKHFPDFVLLPDAEKEIKRLVDQKACFAKREDCLDLPPLVKVRIETELAPEQRRLYESMRKNFVAMLKTDKGETKASIAELVITKVLRMQQIVSGHLRVENDDGTVATLSIKDNPRKKTLQGILEDICPKHKVIVWSVFRDNYQDIREVCEKLGLGYVELTGETKDKPAAIKQFNEDPETHVLIGNQGAGGIGVNLVAASYMVYYTRSFSLEHDIQSEARNYRGGSEIHSKITRIDIVAPQTIDELVLETLANKQEISESILRQNFLR